MAAVRNEDRAIDVKPGDSDRPAVLGGSPVRPEGPPPWPADDPDVQAALQQMAADRSWGRYHGPHCPRLIERLQALHACEHVILCSSGTAAVELAMRGLRVGSGDEVILAAYDFKANFTNILTIGALPVLVDVDPVGWQMDVAQVEAGVTPRTKAVIASHLHGGLVEMAALRSLADRHGFAIIEDACQAQGAEVAGRPTGTWGDAGVISFGGSKLLTAGRGGAVITNRDDVAQRIRLYCERGNDAYPLSEMQAAVLLPQLDQLQPRNLRRKRNAVALAKMLPADCGLSPHLRAGEDEAAVYYKLAMTFEPARFDGMTRDRFAEAMRAEGIALDAGFRGLHLIHARRRFRAVGGLPFATEADQRLLVLHHPVLLGEESDLRQIARAVEKIRRHATMLAG